MAQLNDLLVLGNAKLINGLGILGTLNADSILPNITDIYVLGENGKRWKSAHIKSLVSDDINVTNYATIGAGQAATGTNTGALRVAGGLSATQNSFFSQNVTATKFIGPLQGNADSATVLKTARTINGTSFNGSANITTANWGTVRTLTIGNTGKSVNGAGNVSWSLSEIGALPTTGGTMSGDISFATIASWPTVSGETYPIESKGLYWSGSSDLVKLFYRVVSSDGGKFIIQLGDSTDEEVIVENTAGTVYAKIGNGGVTANNFYGNATTATTLKTARTLTIGNTGKSFNGSSNVSWTLAEIGAVAKTGDTMTGNLTAPTYIATQKMVVGSTGLVDLTAAGTTRLYADGLAISNPTTKNDDAWIRVTGTGESDTFLEIATGDDAGGSTAEQIVVRQYGSSGLAHEIKLLDGSGNTYLKRLIMNGALDLANGTWNKAGDDAQFGDNNTAGSFAIQGLNGNTNLKMVTYGGSSYGTMTWDGSFFKFSNKVYSNGSLVMTSANFSLSGTTLTITTT